MHLRFNSATYFTIKFIKPLILLASINCSLCYMVLNVLMSAAGAAGAAGWYGRVGAKKLTCNLL
jgi:hypothetical protein